MEAEVADCSLMLTNFPKHIKWIIEEGLIDWRREEQNKLYAY